MIGLILKCLIGVFGGMAGAVLAGLLAWNLFKLIRLPELGPWAVLVLLIVIPGAAQHGVIQMMLLFLGIIGLALLSEGPVWRERNPAAHMSGPGAGGPRRPKRWPGLHMPM